MMSSDKESKGGNTSDDNTPTKRHSPRCVPVHPKEFPAKAQLEKLFVENTVAMEPDVPRRWLEGDMLWGKIKGYPYWPCMVSKDPFSKLSAKPTGPMKAFWSYHVQFFGADAERSWVNEASVLVFEGREKFLEIVQFGLESPSKNCKNPDCFRISTAWFPMWNMAVAEAEAAFKLSRVERVEQYAFKYIVIQGDKERPVDKLLKAIWRRCGMKHTDNDQNISEGAGSDSDSDGDEFGYRERKQRAVYDSDDFYSSDEESSCEAKRWRVPVIITVREGQFDVFLSTHTRHIQSAHAAWSSADVKEHLRQQWCLMSRLQRSRYVSRHQKPVRREVRRYRQQSVEILEDTGVLDPLTLDLCVLKLSMTSVLSATDLPICVVCAGKDDVLECEGLCGVFLHARCSRSGDGSVRCCYCDSDSPVCFCCQASDVNLKQCDDQSCVKWYHEECVQTLRHTRARQGSFACPRHLCHSCEVSCSEKNQVSIDLCQCVHCPAAYHATDHCVPAGSRLLTKRLLICPRHFKPSKKQSQHSSVHVKKCLSCGQGGELLSCCECPAAYHVDCVSAVGGTVTCSLDCRHWQCVQCVTGLQILYGEIVWAKLGNYRWWACEVCHPGYVPQRVRKKTPVVGEFPVRFFGSQDFAWLHRGRVYSYQRGYASIREKVYTVMDQDFVHGLQEAATGLGLVDNTRRRYRETIGVEDLTVVKLED